MGTQREGRIRRTKRLEKINITLKIKLVFLFRFCTTNKQSFWFNDSFVTEIWLSLRKVMFTV